MNFPGIAQSIIDLKKADLELRDRLIREGRLDQGYDKEMEEMHRRNAHMLEGIIDDIGYPTVDKVGQEGSDAAWIIIQHAIALPTFMRKCSTLLEKAVSENQASPLHLAYLQDRIAVFEGKAQPYGTQFDWDENGQLSPSLTEDPYMVDQRRASLGIKSLEEQTQLMRRQVREEGRTAPPDMEKRKKDYEEWRKRVGWID